jgi:hypothetical protein
MPWLSFRLRYHGRMKSDAAKSPEFDKFDRLVGQVLAVPKAEIQRIAADERKPETMKRSAKKKAAPRG